MHAKAKQVQNYLLTLQEELCQFLAEEDGKNTFSEDRWRHGADKGGGRSRVLVSGNVFEQAGVNFSYVEGDVLPPAATATRPELAGQPFTAMGVSLVLHPQNPYVPTAHANVRFFCTDNQHWWFGGGYDLTPYYGFIEDCQHWHKSAQLACAPFGADVYSRLKRRCDEYFYLKHRQEPRGIGGIFFDDWQEGGFANAFAFLRAVGDSFWSAYQPIVARRKQLAYGQRERDFQLYRRGRYVEFNLVYDRGTLFGLQFGGRVESILMSLPPQVTWRYNWRPEPLTPEALLYTDFLPVRDWV